MNIQQGQSRFQSHFLVDIEKAAEMWRDDRTAVEIAGRFGVTKAAILGIAYRNREKFPSKKRIAIRDPNAAKRPVKLRKLAEEVLGPAAVEITSTAYDQEREPLAKTLMEIETGECRFPIDNGHPFMFCASEVIQGSAYCAHHHLRAYRARVSDE